MIPVERPRVGKRVKERRRFRKRPRSASPFHQPGLRWLLHRVRPPRLIHADGVLQMTKKQDGTWALSA